MHPISSLSSQLIQKESEIKELRIIVEKNLRFSNHIRDKVNKFNQIMGLIGRTMVHLNKHLVILTW